MASPKLATLGLLALAWGQAAEGRLTRREHMDEPKPGLLSGLQEARPVDASPSKEEKRSPVLRRQVVADARGGVELPKEKSVAELPCGDLPCVERPIVSRTVRTANEPLALPDIASAKARGALLQTGASVAAAAMAQVGPFSLLGDLCKPKGLCGMALLLAALGVLYVKLQQCCGENSCWTRCSCWKYVRLKAGLDQFAHLDLAITVHRCRDLPLNNEQLFVAVFPRRSSGTSKPPKLDKGNKTVRTAKTGDLVWEQELGMRAEQGVTSLQFVLFKTARIGKGTPLGWDRIKISDVLESEKGAQPKGDTVSWAPEAPQKHWLTLHGDDGQRIGSLQVTVKAANRSQLPKKSKGGGLTEGESSDASAIPRPLPSGPADFESELDMCTQALTGPLHQADKQGDYQLRWFRLELKRGVAAWAWYASRDPPAGTKPIGRIPVLSITLVHPVPKSTSEFVLRYSNANRRMVDMMLQRHDRPRDAWITALHKCIEVVRAERQALTQKKAEEESADAAAGGSAGSQHLRAAVDVIRTTSPGHTADPPSSS